MKRVSLFIRCTYFVLQKEHIYIKNLWLYLQKSKLSIESSNNIKDMMTFVGSVLFSITTMIIFHIEMK